MARALDQQLSYCFRCRTCAYTSAVVKAVCPTCGNTGTMAPESAIGGHVVDFVPVLYPPENLKGLGRYVSVLVRLDTGCQAFGVFRGDPERLQVGTPMVVSHVDAEPKVPFFDVATPNTDAGKCSSRTSPTS